MQSFFDQMEAIYCLCLPQRKHFVMDQSKRLHLENKLIIVDALTPESYAVKEAIKGGCFYPILTDKVASVACTLGVQWIMKDIVKYRYNYAMVYEDDVYFPDRTFAIANKHITQQNIAAHFNLTEPYNLYLQSAVNENSYNQSGEGIAKKAVIYGEPAYITNYHACQLLLRYLMPITAPFDEYKRTLKRKCVFNEGILLPYVCRELSANCHKYASHYSFVREIKHSSHTLESAMIDIPVTISTCDTSNHLIRTLIQCIHPKLQITEGVNNEILTYSINQWERSSTAKYLFGATLTDCQITAPSFIISVRGKRSVQYIQQKYGFSPPVGNLLSLYRKFMPYPKKVEIGYLLIYTQPLPIMYNNRVRIMDPTGLTIAEIIKGICSAQCVVTDLPDYLCVAHSYAVKTVYATLNNSKCSNKEIMADYYSTFMDPPLPVVMVEGKELNGSQLDSYPQLPPIDRKHMDMLIDIIPFRFGCHRYLAKNDLLLQIYP